ncbi:MAG: hypothetical protein WBE86_08715 [Candidatus Acidiferrales bacterium]
MAEEALGAAQGKLKPTLMWWSDHRLRYNAGLLVACAIGFFLYDVAVSRCIALKVSGDWEISGFTLFGQVVFYAVMVGLANVFYWLGPWSERLLRPREVAQYRKITFQFGFWFSVLLPFAPAAHQFILCSHSAK